jgi:preprotein translocase subunit SecG
MALQIFLLILIILACTSLIFLVIIQNSKGGGLASNMRAAALATQLMGPRRDADFVEKATWWMISLLVLITFVANFSIAPSSSTSGSGLMLKDALEKQTPNMAPTEVPQLPNSSAPAGTPTETSPEAEKSETPPPAEPAAPAETPTNEAN